MSNRTSGYYRKNGTWVSPDGLGRKRGGRGNGGNDFNLIIIFIAIIVFFWLLGKCSK